MQTYARVEDIMEEGVMCAVMLMSAAGAEFSSTAAVGQHSANLGLRQRVCATVLDNSTPAAGISMTAHITSHPSPSCPFQKHDPPETLVGAQRFRAALTRKMTGRGAESGTFVEYHPPGWLRLLNLRLV